MRSLDAALLHTAHEAHTGRAFRLDSEAFRSRVAQYHHRALCTMLVIITAAYLHLLSPPHVKYFPGLTSLSYKTSVLYSEQTQKSHKSCENEQQQQQQQQQRCLISHHLTVLPFYASASQDGKARKHCSGGGCVGGSGGTHARLF